MTIKRNLKYVALLSTIMISTFTLCSEHEKSDDAALKERIERFITESELNGFSGAVLVTKNGKPIVSRGAGFADKSRKIKNTVNTVFDIGSLTKQFTAAAIMTLVEQDKLTLSDTVGRFFEDSSAEKAKVTIHQLLTHSAGFETYSGRDFEDLSKMAFLKQVLYSKLLFEPGSAQSYSNVGFGVLAAIIEEVSQVPYENYLQEHLFKPAGMAHTGYLLPSWSLDDVAHAYQLTLNDVGTMLERYQQDGVSWNLLGNGGIHSSMSDMGKWDKALNGGQILDKSSLALLYTPHVDIEDNIYSNGYGWRVRTHKTGTKIVTHSGSNDFFYTDIFFLLDKNVSVLFSTNDSHFYDSVTWVGVKIRNMVLDKNYVPKPIEPSPFQLSKEYVDKVNQSNLQDYLVKIQQILKAQLRDPGVLNEIGFWHLERGDKDWAMSLFKLNTELHPQDGNIWDSLGEAYLMTDQPKLSKESFEVALSLGENGNCYWCENSQKQLKELSERSK